MSPAAVDDLQSFIEACKEVTDWRRIEGVDLHLELGSLVEATAELIPEPPMLLFDRFAGHDPGQRIVSLLFASYRRVALALGLPLDRDRLELVRLAARKIRAAKPVEPVEVPTGPVMSNVRTGGQVDLGLFPVPVYHAHDGGPYIGTGDCLINRDPDTGFVNVGTYRMQRHEADLLGLWMSPGQQGRLICQQYWNRGQGCPVAACFGLDPITFMGAHNKLPWQQSELGFVGGLRGRPLEVVRGPLTGLPIPAHAEVAIEGEVPPPDVEAREEGPFGEWPGYYSGGSLGTGRPQPVIRVRAVYFRDDPVIMDEAPLWPGALKHGLPIGAGVLWDQLESAGVPDIAGVWMYTRYLTVVSIRQRYAGHARQTAHAALGCAQAARNGRYIVVVDEDIDPTDLKEVLWAMETRVDPAQDIELVDSCWSTPLDPRMPPDKRSSGDHTNSRALIYAVRPFPWRERFPRTSRTERERRRQTIEKFRSILPFPPA